MRDMASNIKAAAGDNGDSIDLLGADSVTVLGLTDPTARITVSDAAATGFGAPPASDLIEARTDDGAFVVGYIGTSRYLRAGAADIVIRGHLSIAPPA